VDLTVDLLAVDPISSVQTKGEETLVTSGSWNCNLTLFVDSLWHSTTG